MENMVKDLRVSVVCHVSYIVEYAMVEGLFEVWSSSACGRPV
jgi:hypothetical protein